MGNDVYLDGECADRLGSASAWDDAATFIEKHTPANTPLRRLAEEGETDEPHEAATMLANLLRHHRPGPDVLHTFRRLHSLLKRGNHLLISDGVISASRNRRDW
jgi:hypothetical protein